MDWSSLFGGGGSGAAGSTGIGGSGKGASGAANQFGNSNPVFGSYGSSQTQWWVILAVAAGLIMAGIFVWKFVHK